MAFYSPNGVFQKADLISTKSILSIFFYISACIVVSKKLSKLRSEKFSPIFFPTSFIVFRSLLLNSSSDNGYFYLVPDLRVKSFNILPLIMVYDDIFYIFLILRKLPFYFLLY